MSVHKRKPLNIRWLSCLLSQVKLYLYSTFKKSMSWPKCKVTDHFDRTTEYRNIKDNRKSLQTLRWAKKNHLSRKIHPKPPPSQIKTCVLSCDLNALIEVTDLMRWGSLFYNTGTTTETTRSPLSCCRAWGMTRRDRSEDMSALDGVQGDERSDR